MGTTVYLSADKGRNNNEWYTPEKYIIAAREVMGSIDLDPASCELANQTVKAGKYYTKEDNGLMYPWYGNVWLNPPYGRLPSIGNGPGMSWQQAFAKKLQSEYEKENIQQAILLVLGPAIFKVYFRSLWQYPICLSYDRVDFTREDGSISNFGFGSVFLYLGRNENKFVEVFDEFGPIVKHISEANKTIALSLW